MGYVQGLVHQQLHTFQHTAEAQRDIALRAFDFKRQLGRDVADGSQVLRGIDQQGFSAQIGAHGEDAFVGFWYWFCWIEVVVDRAVRHVGKSETSRRRRRVLRCRRTPYFFPVSQTDIFMAYELHIARAENNVIAPEEWRALCATDSSMVLQDKVTAINPTTGATIAIGGNQTAYWTSPTTKQAYYFDYRLGEISFVYSDETIVKAKAIAQSLAATIRGDEGEEY